MSASLIHSLHGKAIVIMVCSVNELLAGIARFLCPFGMGAP